MEPEKNIHDMFEEIAKENPAQNKYKRKPSKGDGTYQTFGMIYGTIYGLIVGYIAGIILDKMSVSIVAGMVIGFLVGRTIGYGFKKRPKKTPEQIAAEKQEAENARAEEEQKMSF